MWLVCFKVGQGSVQGNEHSNWTVTSETKEKKNENCLQTQPLSRLLSNNPSALLL